MINDYGKLLVETIRDCDDSVYWNLIDNYNHYMNYLNKTKNEEYSFDGEIIVDYIEVR